MTRPVSISIPHELGAAEARRRLDEGIGRMMEQSGAGGIAKLDKRWEGDRMSFSAKALGQGITGRLDVLDREIRMEVDLPTFLAVIADKIKGRLRKEGQILLEKK
jgi:hypothetical protein